jgi:hypothetical protein
MIANVHFSSASVGASLPELEFILYYPQCNFVLISLLAMIAHLLPLNMLPFLFMQCLVYYEDLIA